MSGRLADFSLIPHEVNPLIPYGRYRLRLSSVFSLIRLRRKRLAIVRQLMNERAFHRIPLDDLARNGVTIPYDDQLHRGSYGKNASRP